MWRDLSLIWDLDPAFLPVGFMNSIIIGATFYLVPD
jgi:hypothetical protein